MNGETWDASTAGGVKNRNRWLSGTGTRADLRPASMPWAAAAWRGRSAFAGPQIARRARRL